MKDIPLYPYGGYHRINVVDAQKEESKHLRSNLRVSIVSWMWFQLTVDVNVYVAYKICLLEKAFTLRNESVNEMLTNECVDAAGKILQFFKYLFVNTLQNVGS